MPDFPRNPAAGTDERSLLHIALPCHGRRFLTKTTMMGLRRMTEVPFRLWVKETPLGDTSPANVSNGVKIDQVVADLPPNAEWLFVTHNDAVPLRYGWFTWLRDRMGDAPAAGFWQTRDGSPHSAGALYSVASIRASGFRFTPPPGRDPCDGWVLPSYIVPPVDQGRLPWWLRHTDTLLDECGRLLFSHLGGGTIGHTWRVPGTLSLWLRVPAWYWAWRVRWIMRHPRPLARLTDGQGSLSVRGGDPDG